MNTTRSVGEPEHEYGGECWCSPELVLTTKKGTEVWVHNATDGRRAPEQFISQAVMEAMDQDHGGIVRVKPT